MTHAPSTEAAAARRGPVAVETPVRAPNLAVVIVTWNRRDLVAAVLGALARQRYSLDRVDVAVIDNHSTDGTGAHLVERFAPERIIDNPTTAAHKPAFDLSPDPPPARSNTLGVRSLSIVRNAANLGGCGGFNTGFAFVERLARVAPPDERPDYVWLVDDDIDLPTDAARRLVDAAEADRSIGLVGSRTCDINDRERTIETTVYYDRRTGMMGDEPAPGHPRRDEHQRWVRQVGGPKGGRGYAGLRDVDVVSACSLLARWSAVEKVGYWDWRYFIYCDDADWCLRFARDGYRVVLNLDAVVYHTPWHHKLTPARLYYAQRNALWMARKVLAPDELRRVLGRRLGGLLRDSLKAMLCRRLFHAEIIRRTAEDVCTGRSGKLEFAGPPEEPVAEALSRRGLLRRRRTIAVLINDAGGIAASRALQERATAMGGSAAAGRPRWVEIVRNDVPDAGGRPQPGEPERVVYSHRWRSKLRRQFGLRAHALVVFDQAGDFPLLARAWNIHVDRRQPERAQAEWGGVRARAAFCARWALTAARCAIFALTAAPQTTADRYG